MRVPSVCLILLLGIGVAVAQPPKEAPPQAPLPAQVPKPPVPVIAPAPFRVIGRNPVAWVGRAPTLSDLVPGKVGGGDSGLRLIMMIESFRSEQRTVKVTRIMREKRQRDVVVDGKTVTQDYTVNIPVTEDRVVETKIPAGPKPVTLKADEVRFFNLKGKEVPIDEVAKSHVSLRPIFLIDQMKSDPLPMSDIARNAVKENFYVAVTEQNLRSSGTNRPRFLPARQVNPALGPFRLDPVDKKAD